MKKAKNFELKNLKLICFYLLLTSLLGYFAFAFSFFPSFEVASENIERQTFAIIQVAVGASTLTLNAFLLSSLITSVISSTLMLITSLLCFRQKSFRPYHALLISIAFALSTYTFVIFLLNPILISYSFSFFDSFITNWPVYVMSILLLFEVLIILSLLIYLGIKTYEQTSKEIANVKDV